MLSHLSLAGRSIAPDYTGIPVFFMFANCPNISILMPFCGLGKYFFQHQDRDKSWLSIAIVFTAIGTIAIAGTQITDKIPGFAQQTLALLQQSLFGF